MSFPPLIHPPTRPLELSDDEVFVLPRTIGAMVGEGRARDAAREGFLRPADIDRAEFHEVEKIWVPLWRVEGSVDGFHVGLTRFETSRGRAGVMPTGGFRHHDGTLAVLARHGYPIDPAGKVKIPKADLVPLSEHRLRNEAAERVLPDVTREDAVAQAEQLLRRKGQPSNALYAKVDVQVKDVLLCYTPLYVCRYRYGGEAVEGGPAIFFTAIDGTTGKVVASHHPSAWRSLKGKLGRLFGG